MFVNRKTVLKMWLNLGLSLTIFSGNRALDPLTGELGFQIPLHGVTLGRVMRPSYGLISFCRSLEFSLCSSQRRNLSTCHSNFFWQNCSLRSSLYFFLKISEIKAKRDQNQEQEKQKKSRIEHLEKTVKHQQQELKKRTSQVSELERVSKPL